MARKPKPNMKQIVSTVKRLTYRLRHDFIFYSGGLPGDEEHDDKGCRKCKLAKYLKGLLELSNG